MDGGSQSPAVAYPYVSGLWPDKVGGTAAGCVADKKGVDGLMVGLVAAGKVRAGTTGLGDRLTIKFAMALGQRYVSQLRRR